jgi:hypothetical protein
LWLLSKRMDPEKLLPKVNLPWLSTTKIEEKEIREK